MKKPILLLLSAAPVLLPAWAQDAPAPPPLPIETVHSDALRLDIEIETVRVRSQWILRGSRPSDYEVDTQMVEGAAQGEALHISARPGAATNIQSYGTLMQMIPVGTLAGKRIRLSARLKSRRAEHLTLWMRTDWPGGPQGRGSPTFYNMADQPIQGSHDWRSYAVVLNVPADVTAIGFGVVLGSGRGEAWADTFKIESVGTEVPVSFDGRCCTWSGREILSTHW